MTKRFCDICGRQIDGPFISYTMEKGPERSTLESCVDCAVEINNLFSDLMEKRKEIANDSEA